MFSSKRNPISIIILYSMISYFEAEILTGSTSIEGILTYPLSTLEGMIFYGFQIAMISDISIRFKFNMAKIYLLGLIYGIMEEGIALFTMESTRTHTLWLSYFGLNITWTIYIMLFHAVITVCSTILIVNVILKNKPDNPFLSINSYLIMIPVLGIIYYTFIYASLNAGRIPDISSVLILIFLMFIIVLFLIFNKDHYKIKRKFHSKKIYSITLSLWSLGISIPFIFGDRIPLIILPVTVFLFFLIFYFYFLCCIIQQYIKDSEVILKIYVSFNATLLILASFNRTILSSIIAVICFGLIVYLGFKRSMGNLLQ
ncbi:MAG: hypothetical protein ACP5GE_03155 [Thermoplasmata archaeon]